MDEIIVRLFVDDSRESQEAWKILRELQVNLQTVPSSGVNLPAAELSDMMFYGLPGIIQLASQLARVNPFLR